MSLAGWRHLSEGGHRQQRLAHRLIGDRSVDSAVEKRGIEDRLRRAIGAHRVHGMGRVTQKRHASKTPAGQGIPVAHWIFPTLGRGAHQRFDVNARYVKAARVGHDFIHPAET